MGSERELAPSITAKQVTHHATAAGAYLETKRAQGQDTRVPRQAVVRYGESVWLQLYASTLQIERSVTFGAHHWPVINATNAISL